MPQEGYGDNSRDHDGDQVFEYQGGGHADGRGNKAGASPGYDLGCNNGDDDGSGDIFQGPGKARPKIGYPVGDIESGDPCQIGHNRHAENGHIYADIICHGSGLL